MNKKLQSIIIYTFAILISLIYSIIVTSQILGFFRLYTPWLLISITIILTIIISRIYLSNGNDFYSSDEFEESSFTAVEGASYAGGFAIIALLFIWPLFRWPFSGLRFPLEWDATFYHFPKAIELFRSGSFWDLSIPYGQYPNGYESLLSFGLSISGNEYLFGFVHGLIFLLLFLSLWLLGKRYTKIPGGILFWGIALLMISGKLVSYGNPWVIFTSLIYTIGKNDLFLGAVILAFILHIPKGKNIKPKSFFLEGMAILTAIAITIKPNSIYIVGPVWIYLFILIWKNKEFTSKGFWKRIGGVILIILPSILWLIRNLVVIKSVFTQSLLQDLYNKNIFANLLNPNFYSDISLIFVGLILVGILASISYIIRKTPSLNLLLSYYLLLITFAITPATVHVEGGTSRILIVWRFGIALLGIFFILLLVLADPILDKVLRKIKSIQLTKVGLAIVICSLSAVIIWNQRSILQTGDVNLIVLQSPYLEAGDNSEYRDVYAFIHKNIRKANILIVEGLPYYTYGPDYTNNPTKLQYPLGQSNAVPQLLPDYLLVTPNFWSHKWPELLGDGEYMASWELVYEDSTGKFFQQK